ncbi:Methionyl-tRNA formyltransferase, mitochondrial [Cladophialophora carrionii]|uniref:methionyl-tRNA formyltransferase n=1 Tax=Cladophialophora carrionii TaxID=86049 RepID=A0A1C1CUJ4_9EURO|nr:Methionyl-tRNA formyltransferase, mitochondrial [Cladophialophora carrionii]
MRRFLFPVATCSQTRSRTSSFLFKSRFASRRFYSQEPVSDDPLRILFCGTDSFSTVSLEALHDHSKTSGSGIISIDVVTRTDKRVGRGRRQLRGPAIKHVAEQRGLAVHQIDTFTGWQPPTFGDTKKDPCNLIIAVSFGLLIPPRILGTAKYGGLNVHPSMLPDLRGPAPVEWSILLGRRNTGVSLQTLHPSRFDEGLVLDQTPQPGIGIPNPDTITSKELEGYLAQVGAEMLVDAIKNKLYIPPYNPIQPGRHISKEDLTHAPKIKMEFRAVDFTQLTRIEVLRRNRACGPLHAFAGSSSGPGQTRRINLDTAIRTLDEDDIPEEVQAAALSIPEAVPYAIVRSHKNINESDKPLIVNTKRGHDEDSRQIVIPEVTVAAMARAPGAAAAARAKFFAKPESFGQFSLYRFSHPLTAQPMPPEVNTAR